MIITGFLASVGVLGREDCGWAEMDVLGAILAHDIALSHKYMLHNRVWVSPST